MTIPMGPDGVEECENLDCTGCAWCDYVEGTGRDLLKADIVADLTRILAEVKAATVETATADDLAEVCAHLNCLHVFGRNAKREAGK